MAVIDEIHPLDRQEFLELVAAGRQRLNAAYQLKWSPKQLEGMLADEEFRELVEMAESLVLGDVVEALVKKAKAGNMRAIEFFLVNKDPKSWRPPSRPVEITGSSTVNHEVTVSIAASVQELLRTHGAGALQPGGILDAIDTTATDASDEG